MHCSEHEKLPVGDSSDETNPTVKAERLNSRGLPIRIQSPEDVLTYLRARCLTTSDIKWLRQSGMYKKQEFLQHPEAEDALFQFNVNHVLNEHLPSEAEGEASYVYSAALFRLKTRTQTVSQEQPDAKRKKT